MVTISVLLVAGFDTTVNSLGCSLRFFALQPEIWHALQKDPSRIPVFFEDTVRMEAPVAAFSRRAARDTDLNEIPIDTRDNSLLAYASANRDDRHYPDPDSIEIDRNLMDLLGMAGGIHACAGVALARAEAFCITHSVLERLEDRARRRTTGPSVQPMDPWPEVAAAVRDPKKTSPARIVAEAGQAALRRR